MRADTWIRFNTHFTMVVLSLSQKSYCFVIFDMLHWVYFSMSSCFNFKKVSYSHGLKEVHIRFSLNIALVLRCLHVLLLLFTYYLKQLTYMLRGDCQLVHPCEDHLCSYSYGGSYATQLAFSRRRPLISHAHEAIHELMFLEDNDPLILL